MTTSAYSNLWGWCVTLGVMFMCLALVMAVVFVAVKFLFSLQIVAILPKRQESHRAQRRQARRGKGRGIEQVAERLKMTPDELRTVSRMYRRHVIPKRRGGQRVLHAPNAELKAVQRRILRLLLRRLRTHYTATGFQPNLSIVHNAAAHTNQAVVIKLDMVDFFPSITREKIEQYFRRIGWNAEAAGLLADLTTHEDSLPQGAPTSPRLSNLVNFVFDAQIERYVAKHHGVYTRYADDITVSYPEDWPRYVRGTIQRVRKVAKWHGYTIHTRGKLRIVRRHQQQRVTGLVVNEKVNLPRAKRRWLRAVEHRLNTTGRASLTPEQLQGYDSLQGMIESQRPSSVPGRA